MQSPIAFAFTSDMHAWMNAADVQGPCCVVDNWTWGLIEITPVLRTYYEAGQPKTFLAKDWKTVSRGVQ